MDGHSVFRSECSCNKRTVELSTNSERRRPTALLQHKAGIQVGKHSTLRWMIEMIANKIGSQLVIYSDDALQWWCCTMMILYSHPDSTAIITLQSVWPHLSTTISQSASLDLPRSAASITGSDRIQFAYNLPTNRKFLKSIALAPLRLNSFGITFNG